MSSRRTSERLQSKPKISYSSPHLQYFSDNERDSPDHTKAKTNKCTPSRSNKEQKQSTPTSTNRDMKKEPFKDSQGSENLRRSSRIKIPNKKYFESSDDEQFIKKNVTFCTRQSNKNNSSDKSSEEEFENFSEGETQQASSSYRKPILFENAYDVEGKKLYGFVTPKKHGSMTLLAKSTPKTPTSHFKALSLESPSNTETGTPRSERKFRTENNAKTPRHVRSKIKEEIIKWVEENTDSEFSADESEFEPSSNEEVSLSEMESEPEEEMKTVTPKKSIMSLALKTPLTRNRSNRSTKTEDYVPKYEDYFTVYSSHKSLTSDHTLDRLKNPRLPTDRLFSLLSSLKLSSNHEKSIASLLEEYKTYFSKWIFILNEGFNIILYGLGSKRILLQAFHKIILKDQMVMVVNGFFPSLTIKDILNGICNEILELNLNIVNLHEAVNTIEEEFSNMPETHLFLLVHNIDGTTLRNAKSQEILSRLAKITNIHLITTIDHINIPLLWDHTKLSNFNFSWWDVTTMLPYSDETAYENSLLVQNSGELALSSLRNVYQSLTTNARGIYMIIVKDQLKNKGNSNYCGMQFKDLYWSCRESFLVSSDLALRAQLTEFLDHKLVKNKRNIDGSEHLIIPIETNLLEQFINEQEKQ